MDVHLKISKPTIGPVINIQQLTNDIESVVEGKGRERKKNLPGDPRVEPGLRAEQNIETDLLMSRMV